MLSPEDVEGWDGGDDGPPRRRRVGWVARAAGILAVLGLIGASISVLLSGGSPRQRDDVVRDPSVDGLLTAADLAGRTFTVVAVEVDGTPLPATARPPSLAFGDRSLQLRTGCDAVDATFEVSDGELRVGGGPTERQRCEGTAGAHEAALLGLLLDVEVGAGEAPRHPAAHLGGGLLQLRRGDRAAWAVDVTEQATVPGVWREGSTTVVSRLLSSMSTGRWDVALQLWDGYGGEFEGDPAGARADLERFARDHPGLLASTPLLEGTAGVTPSPVPEVWAVATVLAEPDAADARRAAAFLVSDGRDHELVRIPAGPPPVTPPPGAAVAPGDRIVFRDTPVEGGATAHVNGVEVPVDVVDAPDQGGRSSTITVPSWARGEVVVTLALSTPEAPVPYAAWYRVER